MWGLPFVGGVGPPPEIRLGLSPEIILLYYSFSQFFEMYISILSLQKESKTVLSLFQRGAEYGNRVKFLDPSFIGSSKGGVAAMVDYITEARGNNRLPGIQRGPKSTHRAATPWLIIVRLTQINQQKHSTETNYNNTYTNTYFSPYADASAELACNILAHLLEQTLDAPCRRNGCRRGRARALPLLGPRARIPIPNRRPLVWAQRIRSPLFAISTLNQATASNHIFKLSFLTLSKHKFEIQHGNHIVNVEITKQQSYPQDRLSRRSGLRRDQLTFRHLSRPSLPKADRPGGARWPRRA